MVSRILRWIVTVLVLLGVSVGLWLSRDAWTSWLKRSPSGQLERENAEAEEPHSPDRLKLSPQAKANLGLQWEPLQLTTYWRTAQMPGVIIERPGRSNRGVTNTLTGIITRIHVLPGHLVHPGDDLFTLRLASEYLQNAQAQLFKTASELRINNEEQERLRSVSESQTLFRSRLLELAYEARRLQASLETHRQDLLTRGVTPEQIQLMMNGKFLTEFTVKAPHPMDASATSVFEVEEIKVTVGELVQTGQTLAYLANHQALDVEGKAFEQEAPLLQKVAKEGWPITMTPLDQSPEWPSGREQLHIRFIANHIDPATRMLSFYLPLDNPSREVPVPPDGIKRIWRFRPGQRVRLGVPVERMDNIFVVPRPAVARDGLDAYVFRQNGSLIERRAVHLRYEDQDQAVLANDGGVAPGNVIAQSGAVMLNRALKTQFASDAGQGHDHAGHSHDH